jgi:dethiobiotin synthetase
MRKLVPGLFITGTDTAVGKTYVTTLIARTLVAQGRSVGVYKPAASGGTRVDGQLVSGDALALWQAAGRPQSLERVCPQSFAAPLAPHLAAAAEGKSLDADLLRSGFDFWTDHCDIVLVEGAGGLMSPLGETEYVADLAYDLQLPMVVVARNTLGVINQVLQTLIVAETFRGGIPLAGIVLNQLAPQADDPSLATNHSELAARAVAPLLANLSPGATGFDPPVDWWALAQPE